MIQPESNHQTAWIIFTGKTDIWWLRFLKSGYRHCFIILNDGRRWMSIDPLAPYTDIQVYYHITPDFNLPNWLKEQGHTTLLCAVNKTHQKPAPFMLYTCVESVKRILGLHCWRIITPWQLYKHLQK